MLVRTGVGLEENVNHVSGSMRDKNGNKNKDKDKVRDNSDGEKRRWDQVQSYSGFLSIFHIPYGTILVWITDSSSYGSLFHTYGIQEMTSSILYHFRIRKSAHCLAHLSARLESLMPGFVRLIVRLPSSYIDPGYVSPCTRK